MESSSAPQTSKFPTMEQELFIPPAKRLCLEIPGGYANNSSHQGWWHFGATRRSSLAHFMEPGASPVKLDIKIDRGIFDSNPLESPLVTDGEKEYTHVSQQETPTTFSPHGLMSPHGASKQYLTSSSSTSSTDAIIHATREIHEQIEEDPYRRFSAGEKMDGSNDAEARFRAHQSEGWMEKYEELVLYQEKNGDCLVPNQYPENPSLAEVRNPVMKSRSLVSLFNEIRSDPQLLSFTISLRIIVGETTALSIQTPAKWSAFEHV
jgi:Helicase associated domain